MARRLKSREVIERELESLRGPDTDAGRTAPAPSPRPSAAHPARSPGMRPTTILLFMAVVFGLCIIIFFLGVQNNSLQGRADSLQAQVDEYQQMQLLNLTSQDAINAASADPWVSQNMQYVQQQSLKYGYDIRAFALLTYRSDGPYWNVIFVGKDCDCQPPIFNSILAQVNAQTGAVPQAFQGLHMNESAFKESVWANLSITF